jgi:outer membrane protein OmpA-like peptidoglycan-associated protein
MMLPFKLRHGLLTILGTVTLAFWFPIIAGADSKDVAQQWVDRGLTISKDHPNSDEEARCYLRALEADPDHASAHFNLAFVLDGQASGNWRGRETAWSDLDKLYAALDHYAAAAHLDPKRDAAYANSIRVAGLLFETPTRRPPDLYLLRANLSTCAKAMSKASDEKARSHLKNIHILILNIEEKISQLKDRRPSEDLVPANEIVKCLSRSFTRGQSPYKGPRVPLIIQFDSNSAIIRPESAQQLREMAQALKNKRLAGSKILIEGHADSRGSADYNQLLSDRRAESVKRYLVENFAMPQGRFKMRGYGEIQPLVPNDTEENRATNRRVEFVNSTELDDFRSQIGRRKRSGDTDTYDILY